MELRNEENSSRTNNSLAKFSNSILADRLNNMTELSRAVDKYLDHQEFVGTKVVGEYCRTFDRVCLIETFVCFAHLFRNIEANQKQVFSRDGERK